MKKLFIVLAVCILSGCTNKTQQAQDCAQGFLDAFIANDFNGAAVFCSDDFNVDFNRAMEDFNKLEDSVKIMIQEQCSKLKANVNSVQRINESDTFIVCYNIVRSCADSTGAGSCQELLDSKLVVVDGKVVSLNN